MLPTHFFPKAFFRNRINSQSRNSSNQQTRISPQPIKTNHFNKNWFRHHSNEPHKIINTTAQEKKEKLFFGPRQKKFYSTKSPSHRLYEKRNRTLQVKGLSKQVELFSRQNGTSMRVRQVKTGYSNRKPIIDLINQNQNKKLKQLFPNPKSSNQLRMKKTISKQTAFKGWEFHQDDFGDTFL